MRNKSILLALAVTVSLLSGCAAFAEVKTNPDVSEKEASKIEEELPAENEVEDSKDAQEEDLQEEDSQPCGEAGLIMPEDYEPAEEFSEYEDPLEDNKEVIYLGDKDGDDVSTRRILHNLIYDKGIDPMSVMTVCASDFAGDGRTEAFVFAGKYINDEYMPYYEGEFWYVDDDEIYDFPESKSGNWADYGRFFDFGKRKYFSISELYTTGSPSDMWTVVDGKPYQDALSGFGEITVFGKDYGVIYHDAYDAVYDTEMGFLMGHTWKPYYFHYDDVKDCLAEFEAQTVSIDKLNKLCDYDILGDIKKEGGEFTSAYKRLNGLVTINYSIFEGSQIEYCNATWNLDKHKYEPAYDGLGSTLTGSNYGGTYERYITDIFQE